MTEITFSFQDAFDIVKMALENLDAPSITFQMMTILHEEYSRLYDLYGNDVTK